MKFVEKQQCEKCNMIVRKDYMKKHKKTKSCINALPRGIINLIDDDDEQAINQIIKSIS